MECTLIKAQALTLIFTRTKWPVIYSFDRPIPLLARKLTVVRTLFLALAFKAARFFVPQKLLDLNPDAAAIDGLASFPFLNTPMILKGLKSELADYLAMVADVAGRCHHSRLVETASNRLTQLGECSTASCFIFSIC